MILEKLAKAWNNSKNIRCNAISRGKYLAYNGTIGLSCFLAGLVLAGCNGFKTEPYIKAGAIASSEKDHNKATSHKSMIGIGVNLTSGESGKGLQKTLGAEYWVMAEPVDEDTEFPHDGKALLGELSYRFQHGNSTVYPFAGLGVENWARNSVKGDEDRFWGDLYFADVSFGLGVEHKNLYCKLGGMFPFFTSTDSGQKPEGKLGPTLDMGIILHKNIKLGLFYSQKEFGEDGSQTDFKLRQYGIRGEYRF